MEHRDRMWIALVHCSGLNLELSLPELIDFTLATVLRYHRLLFLRDFTIHAEAEISRAASEFMDSIISLGLFQHVNGPMHVAGTHS